MAIVTLYKRTFPLLRVHLLQCVFDDDADDDLGLRCGESVSTRMSVHVRT